MIKYFCWLQTTIIKILITVEFTLLGPNWQPFKFLKFLQSF